MADARGAESGAEEVPGGGFHVDEKMMREDVAEAVRRFRFREIDEAKDAVSRLE